MAVLFGVHQAFEEHDTGSGHPESSRRLQAIFDGIDQADLRGDLVEFMPRAATRDELLRVHPMSHIDLIEQVATSGGGHLDPDTVVSPASYRAALHAAGAGLDAMERLDRGEADSAFVAVRPPGHHATRTRAMGFCLFNNVAVTTAALVARGDRVVIIDWDAHHGNGTQEIFYDSPDVLFVSFHQYPYYPGTGAVNEVGIGAGLGTTINFPFPSGTSGDAYRLAFDALIYPAVEAFSPNWLVVSAGFDAHRRDPLTDLGLSAGDFADLTAIVSGLAPPRRRIFFLEGGYDHDGIAFSSAATLARLAGRAYRPEPATSDAAMLSAKGGPSQVIEYARSQHDSTRQR